MRLAVLIDELGAARHFHTDVMLAFEATNLGHEVSVLGVGDVTLTADDRLIGEGHRAGRGPFPSTTSYLAALCQPDAAAEMALDSLDVMLLRNHQDPTDHNVWKLVAGLRIAHLAMARGVLVLDHPEPLLRALDKLYLHQLPLPFRPRSLVTRDPEQVRAFARAEPGPIVVKPTIGACGRGVFLVREPEDPNLVQMVEVAARDGYVIAQEYVPEAAAGTIRLFVLEGRPLQVDGRYAALRQIPSPADHRSNVGAGASVAPVTLDRATIEAAEVAAAVLASDGLHFLAALDMAGDKVLEINVLSPGGMWGAERFGQARFVAEVIKSVERRVAANRSPPRAAPELVLGGGVFPLEGP